MAITINPSTSFGVIQVSFGATDVVNNYIRFTLPSEINDIFLTPCKDQNGTELSVTLIKTGARKYKFLYKGSPMGGSYKLLIIYVA